MVLMDAFRLQKLWARAVPYTASLMVSDVLWQAFGPPPPPSQILKASGLTRQQFVTATAQGTASALALNLVTPDCEHILLVAIGREAACINHTKLLQVIGRLYRSLEVTARRSKGRRIVTNTQAANWAAAVNSDALPLHLLRFFLDLTNAAPDAAGLAMLLRSTTGGAVLDFGRLGVGLAQLLEDDDVTFPMLEDTWGVHNCTTDVLALWANVTRRTPVTLEKWAKYECDCDSHFYNVPMKSTMPPEPTRVLSIKEYDPDADRYFAHCDTTTGADPKRYAWLAPADVPEALRTEFARRRAKHRATLCGRILGTLLAASGEYGVAFVCRLADVLHSHLRAIVPGDCGLMDKETLMHASTFLTRPGYHLSWRAICNTPWFTKVAVNAVDPPNAHGSNGILTTMRLARRALESTSVATALITFAEVGSPRHRRCTWLRSGSPRARTPSTTRTHASPPLWPPLWCRTTGSNTCSCRRSSTRNTRAMLCVRAATDLIAHTASQTNLNSSSSATGLEPSPPQSNNQSTIWHACRLNNHN